VRQRLVNWNPTCHCRSTPLRIRPRGLKYDIDDTRRTDRWSDAPPDVKDLFHRIEWNIINGEHTKSSELISLTLEHSVSARTLIAGPMATGIAEVGRRFKMDEYFLPEVMMSAKCMHVALGLLKPLILAEKSEHVGTVVVGTVQAICTTSARRSSP